MDERTTLRFGALSAIAGAVVALVSNLLHPQIRDFADPVRSEMDMVAASGAWIPIHLGILAGTLLIIFGLFAVARSLKGGPAEGLARLALGSLLISAPVGIVTVALDGYATKAIADAWAGTSGPPQEVALAAGRAVGEIGWALFMAFTIMLLGVTPMIFGWAVAASRAYPAAVGWPAVAIGAVSAVVGVLGFLAGPSAAFFLAFTATSGLLTIWVLALGVLLTRRAAAVGAPAPTPAPA